MQYRLIKESALKELEVSESSDSFNPSEEWYERPASISKLERLVEKLSEAESSDTISMARCLWSVFEEMMEGEFLSKLAKELFYYRPSTPERNGKFGELWRTAREIGTSGNMVGGYKEKIASVNDSFRRGFSELISYLKDAVQTAKELMQ